MSLHHPSKINRLFEWNLNLWNIYTVLKKASKETYLAVILLFNTKNFNRLDMLMGKVNFFITPMISTERGKLHFNIQVSKPNTYIAQNQINIKNESLQFAF